MYKIVNITDLNVADIYISSDQIIEISSDLTKMYVADNDYDHKSQAYLSACITNADNSLNAYLSAVNALQTTYFTSDITDVYITNGNLIDNTILDKITSSDAFLTKEGCKELETRCIAYINEMKNKAVSIIMAQLNESFIAQQSVGKAVYGQADNDEKHLAVSYISDILQFQSMNDKSNEVSSSNYNFETGEFSLAALLFDKVDFEPSSIPGGEDLGILEIGGMPDIFIDNYMPSIKSYGISFIDIDDVKKIASDSLLFNSNSESKDFKISVPDASFDYMKNQVIPIAPLIETVLKNQIKKTIKTVCDKYISKMTSVPTLVNINS